MEIAIENESRSASLPQKSSGTSPEQHTALEEVVFRVGGQLSTVNRMQKYFRTRENRNFSTVRSTEGRILRFSLVEVGMMVGMAGLQVLVVRFFFQGARKGMLRMLDFPGERHLTDIGGQATYEVCRSEVGGCFTAMHNATMEMYQTQTKGRFSAALQSVQEAANGVSFHCHCPNIPVDHCLKFDALHIRLPHSPRPAQASSAHPFP